MICVIIINILDFRPTQTWLCLVIPYVPKYPCNCFSVPLKIFEPNLLLGTMLMLPRSMIVVFRISTRTLRTLCWMFPDRLSKLRCSGKHHEFSLAPSTKCFWNLLTHYVYHVPPLVRKDIPLILVWKHIFPSIILFNQIITFSFPLFCLTLLVIYMT